MGGSEQQFVKEAFDANWIAPIGPNITSFENDLEDHLGMGRHVAVLSSGTAAMHLALILLGVDNGDEVICQSMTFSASANPIVYLGATPIFVDSEPETWNISPDYLEEAIIDRIKKGKKPKAIIGVHQYGMPFKINEIRAIANKYNIALIEDAAESLGSTYLNEPCGSFGDLAILSFNGNKIITTSGGGALVTGTAALKDKAIFLATQAKDKATHYEHSEIGYNYRLSNVCAGIGRGQMEVLKNRVEARRKVNDFYVNLFNGVDGVSILKEPSPDFFSNHWLSCILIDPTVSRFDPDEMRLHLETHNIESRPVWKPMHLQPIFKNCPYYGEKISEELFLNGLCLPSGSNLSDEDLSRIKDAILQRL